MTPNRRGRKRKIDADPTIITQLETVLSSGATVKDACAYVGIHVDTFYDWCNKDSEFSDSMKKARAQAKVASVAVIRKAAQSNWQAAAWFLERSDPENWGRTTKHILDVEPGLLKRLQEAAKENDVDLAAVFEAMINEFASLGADSEEQP